MVDECQSLGGSFKGKGGTVLPQKIFSDVVMEKVQFNPSLILSLGEERKVG